MNRTKRTPAPQIEAGNHGAQSHRGIAVIDLIQRLRGPHVGDVLDMACDLEDLCQEAATTIEHLHNENARLVAAAPDMLAALHDVESKIVDFEAGRINWRPDDFLLRVRAAIIKATGGQS